MADILNTVSIISFIAAGVFTVLAIAFWVIFKIPTVMGDLSGRNAKKSIERMRRNNEKTGNKVYKTSEKNLERGKLTGSMEAAKQAGTMNGETGLLNENMATNYDSRATGLLNDETAPMDGSEETEQLDDAVAKVERQPASIHIKLIDRVLIIHTEEVI